MGAVLMNLWYIFIQNITINLLSDENHDTERYKTYYIRNL